METPLRFVVDASVGIKLFVDEQYSDRVHALFEQLAADPPANLFVPDLFYIECANILLKYVRRFGRPLEDSRADLADLNRLSLRVTPTAELMEDAMLLAAERNITAYDACYAVLATRLGIPLLTADEPLAEAIENVCWIGNLDL
ncbi:MAG: type II toxin-antitoxin system VapC family toxin [Anaerolineales bacterium]|jgi:predicted nucleic acid-binding protein